ncbi:GSCFA domain-containing protein [Tenacibaculum litopenaei]|uniref:GSCFA domain-containing protein n=1 Tax=Tenacibaculum litopenaei TaxID=396016 RepID=UPI0038954C51
MNLITEVPVAPQKFHRINYHSKILLLGSCFSENIGNKLQYFQFYTHQNPLGIAFHPKAIETLVQKAINRELYHEDDLFYHLERWHNFDAHSSLSSADSESLLANLNTGIHNGNEQLRNASHLIITLGTAWVYRHIASDKHVANCHKVPQKKFLKELLTSDDTYESLAAIQALVKAYNPNIQIILTVSPVRHIKDGMVENQRSKAHLLHAVHQLCDEYAHCHYFPSYEIQMDELRDYRFYQRDMVHPNELAIDYIWEKFANAWIDATTASVRERVATVRKGMAHRPFNPNGQEHQKFLASLARKREQLQKEYPHMQF